MITNLVAGIVHSEEFLCEESTFWPGPIVHNSLRFYFGFHIGMKSHFRPPPPQTQPKHPWMSHYSLELSKGPWPNFVALHEIMAGILYIISRMALSCPCLGRIKILMTGKIANFGWFFRT